MKSQDGSAGYADMWRRAILPLESTIRQAISNLDEVGIKIVLVLGKENKFLGTLSDGDVRRGLLNGLSLNSTITELVNHNSLTALPDTPREFILQLMQKHKIQQIPIVNIGGELVGLHLWDKITQQRSRTNSMVIMAGGKGMRLFPHTKHVPKPMVLIAGKPMLEHIIARGKLEGFNHFILAIHHLGSLIESHFGDGSNLDVKIEYLREQSPLGTAGALSLFESRPEEPFLVTNGDVLTDIRYGDMLDFHTQNNASATMAVRLYEWQHPFGVVKLEGNNIMGFEEKPIVHGHINAGVYVLSPDALDELEAQMPCDMPSLFSNLQVKSKKIIAYPINEPWLDVGRPLDLEEANKKLASLSQLGSSGD